MLAVIIYTVLILITFSLVFYIAEIHADENAKIREEEWQNSLIHITVLSVEGVNVEYYGGVLSGGVTIADIPYITMETEEGETITGIIDITTLEIGDKIVIRKNPQYFYGHKGYSWYKFVSFQY